MFEHRQYEDDSGSRVNDPEPISIGIALFGAAVGAAGLIRNYRQQQLQSSENERRRRRYVREVGKRLTELCDSYRELVDIYDEQNILDAELAPGAARIKGDEQLIARIDRLRTDIFEAGKKVEKALDDLSEYIDNRASNLAQEYSEQLLNNYRKVMKEENEENNLRHFVASLGELLMDISKFHYSLSKLYDIDQVANTTRTKQISTIVRRLRERVEDPTARLVIG